MAPKAKKKIKLTKRTIETLDSTELDDVLGGGNYRTTGNPPPRPPPPVGT